MKFSYQGKDLRLGEILFEYCLPLEDCNSRLKFFSYENLDEKLKKEINEEIIPQLESP